jgi:hypothetical protein
MALRWEGDTRLQGIGSAQDQVPPLLDLLDAMQSDAWVSEEPEAHLLPHILRHCESYGAIWRLDSARLEGVVYVVTLQWRRRRGYMRDLSVDAYSLIGEFAESSTHIRAGTEGQSIVFEVTTGMLDGDGPFSGHGHVVRLRVVGPAVEALLTRSGPP